MMADPVSVTLGVLGVLPLISMALKTYRDVRAKFNTLRSYSQETKRLSTKLAVEKQLFTNHCGLLVTTAIREEDIVIAMMNDHASARWHDQDLEARIRKRLQDNYKTCRNVVELIICTLSKVEKESFFDVLTLQKLEGECIKDTIRRLHSSLRITFQKTKYEGLINDLRDGNDSLRRLLEHFRGNAMLPLTQTRIPDKACLEDIQYVQKASKELHELLLAVWNCRDAEHSSHNIKLCLDAHEVSESVCLGLMCCPNTLVTPNCRAVHMETTRQIQVQSTYKHSMNSVLPNSLTLVNSTVTFSESRNPSGFGPPYDISSSVGGHRPSESSDAIRERSFRRMHVHFAANCGSQSEIPPDSSSSELMNRTLHLSQPRSLCFDLMNRECSTHSDVSSNCSGFFEASCQDFNFVFHSPQKCLQTKAFPVITVINGKPTSLHQILLRPQDETIDPIDQVKLARRVAAGLLRFHSTPWIDQSWSLKDLYFFGRETSVSDFEMQTLHLNEEFTSRGQFQRSDGDGNLSIEGPEHLASSIIRAKDQNTEDNALDYETRGIRNQTLYRLGVALLEIGYWCDLNPSDVKNIRQLANPQRGPRKAFPRYLKIVRRCLDCDFAFGTDLTERNLQAAVHDKVLRELDDMIAAMDISEG